MNKDHRVKQSPGVSNTVKEAGGQRATTLSKVVGKVS